MAASLAICLLAEVLTMRQGISTRSWRCRAGLCGVLSLALCAAAGAVTDPAAKPSASTTTSKHSSIHKKRAKTKGKKKGQQVIDTQRARQIQEALIREHYMEGQPSGNWDSTTQTALRRYQADQGWQSKTVPDSRALIKLGLGPNHDHLLNPESAMTTTPLPAKRSQATPSPVTPPASNSTPQ